MSSSPKRSALRIITGEDASTRAVALRALTRVVEPFYATAMRLRNIAYDRGILQTHNLGRPAISIGNITTGGTGKTPVVQWLADRLRSTGRHPAILLRGYGATRNQSSDEATLLDQSLNTNGLAKIPIGANPSRVVGAARVLQNHPEVDLFLLDDAFQHRRASRDFNLVLISATQPFGFGHVLPRGLLREPLAGLARADAFLITRCSLVTATELMEVDQYLAARHPAIPVLHADHQLAELSVPATGESLPIESLKDQSIFVTAGIGDPVSFARQLETVGCKIIGTRWFADHHVFSSAEIADLLIAAKMAGATRLITTEKDWVKIKNLFDHQTPDPLISVIKLKIKFHDDDETRLLETISSIR